MFRAILSNRKAEWKFNASPIFMEFLMGHKELTCTPWGMPTYSVFGWQKPCYLLQDGYADTFQELMEAVEWSNYGTESGNPRCANCMVHSGYEASGVNYSFGSIKGMWKTVKAMVSDKYEDQGAMNILNEWKPEGHGPLVQIAESSSPVIVTTSVNEKMTSVAGD